MTEENAILSFLFPQTIGRLSYALRLFLCILVMLIVQSLERQKEINGLVAMLATLIMVFYTILYVYAPRMRDACMEKMWLILIPVVNVVLAVILLFAPEGGLDSMDG